MVEFYNINTKVFFTFVHFKAVVTKLRLAKNFIRPAELFLKNIYPHFEPQLHKIMSGILQFQFFYFLENTLRFWEKNSKIRDEIELKTFFFFRDYYDFGRKIAKDLCSAASRVISAKIFFSQNPGDLSKKKVLTSFTVIY